MNVFAKFVDQMEGLLAASLVRVNLQRALFERKSYLIQSCILVHQQHVVQGHFRHETWGSFCGSCKWFELAELAVVGPLSQDIPLQV